MSYYPRKLRSAARDGEWGSQLISPENTEKDANVTAPDQALRKAVVDKEARIANIVAEMRHQSEVEALRRPK